MNKLVIFDLDGVLIDSKDHHYDSLNQALGEKYSISREEHLKIYDGLPTKAKLELLTKNKHLPVDLYDKIWRDKQEATLKIFNSTLNKDYELMGYFQQLADAGFKIAVASNSIRNTVKIALLKLGILEFVDMYVSNEDVVRNKPFPEMYWKCMTALNAVPEDTVIIEDSYVGKLGVIDSKAHLVSVENRKDLNQMKIDRIKKILQQPEQKITFENDDMNILIPMAGAGNRFASRGYTFPKPLIEIYGKPMIQFVVENINIKANYIFIVQKEHYQKYNLNYLLPLIAPKCNIVQVDGLTEGAACTTLLAKKFVDNDKPLLIANSDQYVEWSSSDFLYKMQNQKVDASILTFESTHPKWSYVKVENGLVTEVAEKKPISNIATVGIYYWKQGRDYVKYAEQMISKNIRVNNEFYVCPVFNEAVQDNKKISIFNIEKMWGIGTPEDLEIFLKR